MQVSSLQASVWKGQENVRRARQLFQVDSDPRSDSKLFLVMKESSKAEVLGLADSDKEYWSAKATAKRILDTAKRLANGDPSKIELLRNAVMQGFNEAERILGGLPDVCRETYDLVMQGFDAWESECNKLNAVV